MTGDYILSIASILIARLKNDDVTIVLSEVSRLIHSIQNISQISIHRKGKKIITNQNSVKMLKITKAKVVMSLKSRQTVIQTFPMLLPCFLFIFK